MCEPSSEARQKIVWHSRKEISPRTAPVLAPLKINPAFHSDNKIPNRRRQQTPALHHGNNAAAFEYSASPKTKQLSVK
jgi:hypothetical protein